MTFIKATKKTTALSVKQCSLLLLIATCTISHGLTAGSDVFFRRSGVPHRQRKYSTLLQFAYIYGEDGKYITDDEDTTATGGDDDDFSTLSSSSSSLFASSSILDEPMLSQIQADNKGLLARLAAAFPPTGMSIQLSHLADVTILEVQETSMALSAVVRHEDQCVTVAVPIVFPTPIFMTGLTDQAKQIQLEECLQELDQKAKEILQQQDYEEENYEEIKAFQRQATELQSVEGVEFPSWWVPPIDTMDTESKSLRSLLNEDDFQADVVSLAKHGIRLQVQEDYYLVLQAGIRSISPAGLMLGALIRDPQDDDPEEENNASNTIAVDIPIPFESKAGDADQLRDNVLDMVETLE